ncbi:MAG: hypothetical protein RBU23_03225 [Candidatus Auribacterota bacterium]|nr:hypothetical protein [Candidatus Auribacterota bacterium]
MRTFHIPIPYTNYRITGWGVGLLLGICAVAAFAQMSKDQITGSRNSIKAWLEIYDDSSVSHAILYVNGVGRTAPGKTGDAQARLMAFRAARVNGYRNLLRILNSSRVIVRSGIERIEGFLQGTAVFDQNYHHTTGTTTATIAYFFQTDDEEILYLERQGLRPRFITAEEYEQRDKQAQTIDESEWKQWQRK